jgi:hypothetical protein
MPVTGPPVEDICASLGLGPLSRRVSILVYATFADEAQADTGVQAIADLRMQLTVVTHSGTLLDGDRLQESATEYGRNVLLSTLAGGVFFMLTGVVASLSGVVVGMGVAMGACMGLLVGILMGGLGALQAGTRVAKKELRQTALTLAPAHRMLTIEVTNRKTEEAVIDVLQDRGATAVGSC